MAGHNKWSKVKHTKGPLDAKRGKLFSRLSREITISAKEGGGDPALNPRLRQAVTSAKSQNMPNDTIERALKKGTGELEGASYEEISYEGYGPNGVAMLVETATDNKNRTAADMRRIFNKGNGSLGSSGSVAYLFDRAGEIRIPASACEEERILEIALEAGANDVRSDEDEHVVLTAMDQTTAVAEKIKEQGLDSTSQKLIYIPQTTIMLDDVSVATQVLRLYEMLDDCDDTVSVHANFDIPDDLLAKIGD